MIQTIGVIGAGQMGSGIAETFATVGYSVILHDLEKDRLKLGLEGIERNLIRQVSRKKLSEEEQKESIEKIKGTTSFKDFKSCDLVIEAATEDEEIKKSILREVNSHLSPSCIIASNTSSISITLLASVTDRPERVIGMHFMNPAPVMQLVEVIRGLGTSDETYKTIVDIVKKLGKKTALSQDFPGFIVNRILMPMINEACYALYEGVGTIRAIDRGMKLGTNHPMGPFELADLIGLDTCCSIMSVLHKGLNGSKYQPCPLLVQYVNAGWLGRKTKKGFYDYSGEDPVPTR